MTVLKSIALVAAAGFSLAGCTPADERVRYDGIPFQVKFKAANKKVSRKDFIVEVKDPLQSEKGARAAGHHGGVSYCLAEAGYGTSKIIWENDPLDEEVPLVIDGKSAVFRGACDA